ncbi:MAG: FecR domain-containing protein [Rhodospirillales bacterium]|nr:FecR domain-containing protein [Rhodospirillales bacterium]
MTRYLSSKLTVSCLAAAMCAAPTLAATGTERVGNAAAVRGIVQLAAISGVRTVGKKVASGEPIFLGDRVTTGAEGRLQIMLLDETVFTIGPKAAIVIDEFVYDPKTSKGKVAASVLKGTFRFVTGKVSKRDPSKMVVRLPVGSIGVRGTSVAGHTDGISATVVLLGPGPNSNTGERIGSITVTGQGVTNANVSVEIVRPGFATRIGGVNQPPTSPVRLDPGQLSAITGQLSGPPPPGTSSEVDQSAPTRTTDWGRDGGRHCRWADRHPDRRALTAAPGRNPVPAAAR